MLITQALSATATKNGSRPAFHYLGKDMTYQEFKTRVSRLSYLLYNELNHHARVAFICRNSPAVAAAFFALTNTRSVTIPIDPDLPPDEMCEWIKETKATHVFTTTDLTSKVRDNLHSARLSLPIIEIEKKQGGEYDTSYTPPPDQVPTDNDPILLFRTRGSSGKPKLVSFNHKQIQHAASCIKFVYHALPTDRFLTQLSWHLPFAFIHGMLFPLINGATCVVDHGLENKEFIDFVIKSRVTRLIGTPPNFYRLLIIMRDFQQTALPGMKSIVVGLGTLPPPLRKTFELLKIPVSQTYGQTENGWTIAMEDAQTAEEDSELKKIPGFIGKGLAGLKYKVMDESGDEITGKEAREGLLAISGPSVMAGYYGNEKETKNSIRGTWLYTFDFARLEGDGETLKIWLIGRKDEVVRREGKFIKSEPIDAAMKGLAGVQDAAGFFVKNTKGQPIFAVAVVKIEKSTVNEKAILDHCATKLPPENRPQIVAFTDVIQRDNGGNVNRIKLSNQFSGIAG